VAGGKAAVAVASAKDLEEGDRVRDAGKEAIEVEAVAKAFPEEPVLVGGPGAARYDSGSDRVLHNAEVRAESMCGRKVHCVHGVLCG
jgi:hypothetical protein